MKNIVFFAFLLFAQTAFAQLRLPSFISSGMVLQQQKSNRIWGWATANQRVAVTFMDKTYPTFADAKGEWVVFLDAADAGRGGDLTIVSGNEKQVLKDILVGEVWVCSGQSNMEWLMGWLPETYRAELDTAHNDQIRFVTVKKSLATTPQQDVQLDRSWSPIDSNSVDECSAVAYFFAKNLQQKLNIPVGLVISSWGGTFSQSWTSFEGLHDYPNYTQVYEKYLRNLDLDTYEQKNRELRLRFEQNIREKAAQVKLAIQPSCEDQQWSEMALPKVWEEQGFPTLDGTVLYRVHFKLSGKEAGKAAILNLPAVDDQDSTFINGKFIGTTNQWNALRTYQVPPGVLKKGDNLLAIWVRDDGGGGGLAPNEAQYHLKIGDKIIPLAGTAKYQIVSALEDLTGGNGAVMHQPALLYNAMIAPILPLTIRGAIWYQGESNASRPWEYRRLFPAMITDWRNHWGQGDFPFLFAQISSFGLVDEAPPAQSNWAELREAQALALALPNTGMAVTVDIGDPNDIHPKQKQEVGQRLAALAMRQVYSQSAQICSGPVFQMYTQKGSKIELEFGDSGSGLMQKGPKLKGFALAGEDRKFHWAEAEILNDRVVVYSPEVPNPLVLRYAWADAPIAANLFNQEGFPAIPFQIQLHRVKNPVIAHRGAWKQKSLPENSIAALRNAIALGCAGSEFDIRMSADDSLVINHDALFHGLEIEKTKFADLRAFPLSNGEKLPTLREYILAGKQNNPGTQLICEIKPSGLSKDRGRDIAAKTVQLIRQLKAEKQVVYISFDYEILKKIIEIDPSASTQYLTGNKSPEELKMDGITGADYHYSVYHAHQDWAARAKRNNLILNAWTVNDPAEMTQLLAAGFHWITTNEPELLLELYQKK